MNNKDVAIIGYWFATNYGGVASYYSLYKKIKEMGYSPFLVETPYLETDKEGLDTFPRNFLKSIDAKVSDCYKVEELTELNKLTNTFVLGSDQVLTSSSIKWFGKLFLMEFAEKSKRKIAISSSCGGDNLNAGSEIVDYARKQLKDFSAVSVREYSAVDIVKDKFDIDAEVIIDPIFFTKKADYEKLSEGINLEKEEPYLLAYVLDPTPDKRDAILKIAKKRNLKVKIALDGRKFTHEKNCEKMGMPEETLPELDFPQWLYYFKHASYVFTDSFHGAAMSIIMNKQFIMYANYMRGYPRFLTLAKMFNLYPRLVEKSESITETLIEEIINFEDINKVIENQCEHGEAWLRNALTKEMKNTILSLLDEKMCTGCSSCANACPVGAINIQSNSLGYYKSTIDESICINCGRCIKVCPALELPEKLNDNVPKCFAVAAKEKEVLSSSSSGGVFTLLARETFKEEGHVVGAAWKDDNTVEHIMIDDISELYKLQKSKYLQSYVGKNLTEVKKKLEQGKLVLFTGCPCQVAGLKKFLRKEYDNLILVDLLCGNAPSTMFFKKYLEEDFPEGVLAYEFRYKKYGWNAEYVKISTNDGSEIIRRGGAQDNYQRVYHNHTMCGEHCENCKYQELPRYGDLTIGDFWGYSRFDKTIDISKGLSVVLANNEKGRKFLDKIPMESLAVKKEVPLEWLGGNGYAIKAKNYSSPYRNRFYDAIQKTSFSQAVEYAFSTNGISNYPNALRSVPLQYNTVQLRFKIEHNVWEEHFINGKTVLTTKQEQPALGKYASIQLMHTLVAGKKYVLSIRFKLKTTSNKLAFHIKEALTQKMQIIYTHNVSQEDANTWVTISEVFVPNSNVYNEFMIGASHITGKDRFLAIDYIDIREE